MKAREGVAAVIAELEACLANYRRTRSTSPRSLHRWCDVLIKETEAELRRLRQAHTGAFAEQAESERRGREADKAHAELGLRPGSAQPSAPSHGPVAEAGR